MKKRIIIIAIAIGILIIGYKGLAYYQRKSFEAEQRATIQKIEEANIVTGTEPEPKTRKKAYIKVPFITQAPFENKASWEIHEESCEEAALYQVIAFRNNIQTIDKKTADEIFQDMIAWQEDYFGSHKDLYADEMKEFIVGYYPDLNDEDVQIIPNATFEEIKKQINAGNPIIAPITGDILKNPYYGYPGYHMLTITGYTEDRIITNDVGTKRGKDFSYSVDRFMKAMNDAGGEIIIIPKF